MKEKRTARRSFSIVVLLLGLAACTKEDSLVLLDLRPSGPLGAPVARIRLSAKGWPTRTVDGALDVAGRHVGYYGPGDGGAVTVIAEALDAADCVLGTGSATVPALEAGAISAPATLFVRPEPARGCVPDAGSDAAGEDAGSDGGGTDAGDDAKMDASDETETDAAVDTRLDTVAEAGVDATPDGVAPDGGAADAGAPDAGAADAGAADAGAADAGAADGGAPDGGASDGGASDAGAADAGAADGDDDASAPDAALE
jgi:hypothetical protein